MENGNEYFKLITDMLDVQQQVGYLLQRTMSVGDDIEELNKEVNEQKDNIQSKPDEERTKEDYSILIRLNNNLIVLHEIYDMHKKLYVKMERKVNELQKRMEQYCKRHNIDMSDSLKKKM